MVPMRDKSNVEVLELRQRNNCHWFHQQEKKTITDMLLSLVFGIR